MRKNESKLTVFWDGAFWVGVYERVSEGELTACKIIFGAEPKDSEVYEFLLRNYHRLRFSPAVPNGQEKERRESPKRRQRAVRRELAARGVGTKAQQALALQREAGKEARRERSRAERAEEKERRFRERQRKKREKHRGR